MFGKHHTLKQLSGGIAIAASLAVIVVPSAVASTSSRSFITDTLGGNGSSKATPDVFERYVAIHTAQQTQAQGTRFITDTLGGNGSPQATPDLFERSVAIHEWHEARAQARAVLAQQARSTTLITDTLGGNGGTSLAARRYDPQAYVNSSFSWTDAGVGAATAAGSMLVLVGSGLLLLRRRSGLAV